MFTGAGISKESGIDTFRDPSGNGGWWANKIGLALFGTPVGWKWLPFGLSWHAYRVFMRPIVHAEPNPGHAALAQLQTLLSTTDNDNGGSDRRRRRRHAVDFTLMTQNVDGLHQRAGSSGVLELHGTVMRHRCIRRAHMADPELTREQIFETKPTCRVCGSYMRPDAVLFTEGLPEDTWRRAEAAIVGLGAKGPGVCLVVGTSGAVYPAASLPEIAAQDGHTTVIEVNPERSSFTERGLTDMFLQGPSGTVLPLLVERVVELAAAEDGNDDDNDETTGIPRVSLTE